ncbi:bestrophin-2 [Penaeus vannamei]|uniref:bestrophin-2 n=1 Tax=Penaeus vannamei TaxID=6689 RepID=UPI00387F6834
MTVSYTSEVADCRGFGNFWKLLFRWRGSVYKLVWQELFLYATLYFSCSGIYRFVLNEPYRRAFEKVSLYCTYFSDLIPVSFVLGFYVSIVIQRWWAQFECIPWPETIALVVSTAIQGHDDRGRLMRRTIMRYVNLAFTLTLRMITPRAKKRFPTLDHMQEAGLMTSSERKIFEAISKVTPHPMYYLPLVWTGSVVSRARAEGRVRDDFAMKTIIDELNDIMRKLGDLLSYDWISVPLVYTQVVSLSVYSFFIATIMGRQFLDPTKNYPNNSIDFYIPVFTFLQFFFYMGWLKVAETLINPFGDDDDDFEVNWLIDRNIQVCYLIVDEMHNEHPDLVQDLYWDEIFPPELPYTYASEQYRRGPPMGSTANLVIPQEEQEILPVLDEVPEEGDVEQRRGSIMSTRSLKTGRRSSMYVFQQRLKSSSNPGSTTSIRRPRPRSLTLNRSLSKVSGSSYLHGSRLNLGRHNTSTFSVQSDVSRVSSDSMTLMGGLCGRDDRRPSLQRQIAHDDDGAIHINIKKQDNEGNMLSGSRDELVKNEELNLDDDEAARSRKITRDEGHLFAEVRFQPQVHGKHLTRSISS